MTKYNLLIISLLFFSCGQKKFKTATNNQDLKIGKITKKQSGLIFEKIKSFPNNTQISIAIIENKKAYFYGVKRENNKIISVDNHKMVFEIGSITKVFTSTLLADFVLENKVKLNDYIGDNLKIQLKDNQNITFKELANHTSGLPRDPQNYGSPLFRDFKNPNKDYDEEKLLEYITDKMELGEKKHSYSNIGAAVLGYTLTKVANKSYQDLLDDRIFSKYEMKNSTTIRTSVADKLVRGLDEDGNVTPNWDSVALVGAGGILSTTEDLSKFALAQFENKNKELELTRKITDTANESVEMGLGWGLINEKNMDKFYAHNGATGGYTSAINIDTKNQNGVIVLSNVSAHNENNLSLTVLCTELLQTLGQK